MKNILARNVSSRWLIAADFAFVALGIGLFTAAVMPSVLGASAYFDEGYSAFLAKLDVFSMASYTALDVHPPLYYAFLHVWQLLVGNNPEALRMLSVVFGWVAIVFAFLIVRRGFGRHAAWTAAVMVALAPLFVRYGATMRMYTMALAIGLAATYVLMIAVTSKKRWPWAAYAVLVAAGMWTNYFMALIWFSHLAWLLFEYKKKREVLGAWRWSVIGAIVLYLPWLPALVYRYGEIQVNGFWIKPLSIDTLVSTVTMSLVFRNAAGTIAWLAAGVIALIVALIVTGRKVYASLDTTKQRSFRLVASLASLPIILLSIISLPPFRSSYVYRYVLFASVATTLVIAVIVSYARFKRHDVAKRVALYALSVGILLSGAAQTIAVGNRNLDTDSQNKLGSVMLDTQQYGKDIPVVVRSPYSYYAAALYEKPGHPVHFIYSEQLAKVGSTKPLYDNPERGVRNFDRFDTVWIVGEDKPSVMPPTGSWRAIDRYTEYDDIKRKPAAFAVLYERVK